MSNSKLAIWITAARLRTLPLSLAGIILGNGIAYSHGEFSVQIFILSLLTTMAFQVLSNLANDYGDGIKGTDNEQRLGPSRVLQQGLLSPTEMKKGIIYVSIISLIFTILLITVSFSINDLPIALFFLLLGIAAIISAIKYTVGNSAYGYFALGDLFVFIFFGGVSVLGAHYLQSQSIDNSLVFLAVAIGLLSTAVLNLNNMRDVDNDRNSNKITIPILLGTVRSRYYHSFLVLFPFIMAGYYTLANEIGFYGYLYLIFLVPLGIHLKKVWLCQNPKLLDPELKKVALITFFFSMLYVGGIILSQL